MKSYLLNYIVLGVAIFFGSTLPFDAHAARLFSSGCEFQGDSPGNLISGYEWTTENSSASASQISATIKRSGLSSCRAYTSLPGKAALIHHHSSVDYIRPIYLRFYMNVQTMPTEDIEIVRIRSTGSTVGTILLSADGRVSYEDWTEESPPDFTTSSPVIFTNTWHRVEVKYNGDDRLTIRVDGVNVLDVNEDSTDSTSRIYLGTPCDNFCGADRLTVGDIYFDDIAINDSEGAYQNSWPGPGAIVHMQPDGPGDISQCLLGSWMGVDEVTPENPSSPNASNICTLTNPGTESDLNSGDKLDVNVESSTSAGIDPRDAISFVSVGIRARANTTGSSMSYRLRLKSSAGSTATTSAVINNGGTTYSTNGLSATSPNNYQLTAYKDPTTLCSWTQMGTSSIDNMQIGVQTVANGQDLWADTLWALVEYSPKFVEPCGKAYGGNVPDAISTASSFSPEYIQKKYGNFWAASIATEKICLGTGANCTTTWNRTPKCRLEHHRVTARPNASNFPSWNLPDFSLPPFGLPLDIAVLPCDLMLSPQSVAAGWVSTGYDKSTRVFSNDGHTPRVCQFTRLVCDPNVELLAPTVVGPDAYPVVDFTTSTNQCSDRLDNDSDGYYDMNDGDCLGWSDNSESGTSGGTGGGGCWGCNEN